MSVGHKRRGPFMLHEHTVSAASLLVSTGMEDSAVQKPTVSVKFYLAFSAFMVLTAE